MNEVNKRKKIERVLMPSFGERWSAYAELDYSEKEQWGFDLYISTVDSKGNGTSTGLASYSGFESKFEAEENIKLWIKEFATALFSGFGIVEKKKE